MTLLSDDANPYDIRREALRRVKEQAIAANEIQPPDVPLSLFFSARVMNMEAAIRKEIAQAKENKRKEELKQQKELAEDFKPLEDKPPVKDKDNNNDGILAEPKRIASREELQNMLYAIDRNYKFLFNQINGLNDALDVIQSDMKSLKDTVKHFEDMINMAEEANNTNTKDKDKEKKDNNNVTNIK